MRGVPLGCVLYVQVGGFFFIHRDDLSKMAPWWLSITEDVRQDKDVSALIVIVWSRCIHERVHMNVIR
jgi:hypothetical protein